VIVQARITHILSSFGMGGQERVAFDLAVSQRRAGCEVTVLSLAPPPDGPLAAELTAAGIAVERVARPRPGVDLRLIVRLARWLRSRHIELVHTHNRMALIYGAPAARLAGAAIVHTKHGNNPKGGTRLIAGNLAGRLVDAFVAVSPETAEFARKRSEIVERKLMVISNGIELSRFHPDRAARDRVRAELGIAADAWVVGTVGRIATEKNQALLVRAMAPLLGPDARLIVARDVPAVLNALDAFALSSDTEGLPLVVLEAMATGLPVVSTRVGGVPTVLDEGKTGFLVPVGDEAALRACLAGLAADPVARRASGDAARTAAVTRFSADRMQRDYLALYSRVLGARAAR